MSVVGNLMALGHTVAGDDVIRNTLANYAFEHYEIAGYMSLLTTAKVALNESLREEEAIAQWIAGRIAPTTPASPRESEEVRQ
jgi:ferritin-like metal-binding protein YciE